LDEIWEHLRSREGASIDLPTDLQDELGSDLLSAANAIYREAVEKAFQSVEASGTQEQRKTREARLLTLRRIYGNICVFEQSAVTFDEPLASDLLQHLLRTLCTEFANSVLSIFCTSMTDPSHPISAKVRDENIAGISDTEVRSAVRTLYDSLTEFNSFHDAVAELNNSCSLFIRAPDRKTRTELTADYGKELRTHLAECSDPPTVLLLAVLTLLVDRHHLAVHASGKFVSPLTKFIIEQQADEEKNVPAEIADSLQTVQRLVVAMLKSKGARADSDDGKALEKRITLIKTFIAKQ